MKKLFIALLVLVCIGISVVCVSAVWVKYQMIKPGTFEETKEFMIPPGSNGHDVTQKLAAENIITQPKIFYGMLRFIPITIKAGEYSIPARSSLYDTFGILRDGKVIERNVTLAEGLTVKQAMAILKQNDHLTGDITITPEEGSLFPDTYNFIRGDTRDSIIKRMQDAHNKYVDDAWAKRKPGFMLLTKNQLLTLASIVEKETGLASERKQIAGLFFNRLKIGMPLQSDPTVVYVITNKLGHMEGKRLYSKSLKVDSPYNTYKNVGLPPGPIANPGRESIDAVLNPEENDYLFFVADGTGGHVFAKTLKEHEANVAKWRKYRKENNK